MSIPRGLKTAYQFFMKHAGYVKGQRAAGALALAKAERAASDVDARFVWDWDPAGAYDMPEATEVLACTMFVDGHPVAGLHGIGDPTQAYGRVIEAELALEYFTR